MALIYGSCWKSNFGQQPHFAFRHFGLKLLLQHYASRLQDHAQAPNQSQADLVTTSAPDVVCEGGSQSLRKSLNEGVWLKPQCEARDV